MSKQTGSGQRSTRTSTGTRIQAAVPKGQRREVVVRATDRVKSSRAVDTTKVDRR